MPRLPRRVVAEQHSGAAGHVQHTDARLYAGVVQNGGDHRLVPHQLSVPARRQPVEEGLYVTLIYHGARHQRKKAAVSICW